MSYHLKDQLAAKIRGKAKPVGSLGRVEDLAMQIGLATGSLAPQLGPAKVIVFAADHGLTAEGVTAYPSVVTAEIAKLVLAGSAGISICARAANASVTLVDAGLLSELPPHASLISKRIAAGTKNARREPAMSADQCVAALDAGRSLDALLAKDNCNLAAYGEIGIGNSSAAALVAHSVTGVELDTLIGPGAGAPTLGLEHKRQVLRETAARAKITIGDPAIRARLALQEFGGFEMVMMAGAMTAAARAGRVIVADGFIASAVAAAAVALEPRVKSSLIFSHCSAEPGHRAILGALGATPLFDLGLRLGEGTGAALAIPLVRTAELMLRDMADLPGEHPA